MSGDEAERGIGDTLLPREEVVYEEENWFAGPRGEMSSRAARDVCLKVCGG